jgi:hypothetical protein
MAEDFVNQLTLNFLISKNQLQKLNKKMKDDKSQLMKTEKEIYGERVKKLFYDLLMNNPPNDLLLDVQNSFDIFFNKCVYYLKAHDNTCFLEKERQSESHPQYIQDDIDYEKEERDIENGNYFERDINNNETNEDEDEDENENEDEDENENEDEDETNEDETNEDETNEDETNEDEPEKNYIFSTSIPKTELTITNNQIMNKFKMQTNNNMFNIQPKHNKNSNSKGVENIQKLPLDWFQNVRQDYKKNQIITKKKDVIIGK